MYLKTLELQGFKSFPDKTVLSFDSNVTAVVGPNGSGKSNISDAIRWVLGEQSVKTLRGGKMEDVIFGGTPLRKRQGFAEVSLTLDNTAGVFDSPEKELMVTRRYYRSGESEYYINRRLVRLKDVNELFMDTGLGQEGYSLIGQGRIDEILSAKSTQRREIFEEAAGISRYRHRKEESQRKLERTQENLLRIGDKLEELELQVEPLRQQAEKAKQYFALRDELRVLEISLWMQQLDRIQGKAAKAQSDYETALRQTEEGKAKADALYALSEQLGEQVRAQETNAEELRGQIAALETRRSQGEHTVALLRERMENNAANARLLRQELTTRKEREGGIGEQIVKKQQRLTLLEEEMRNHTARLDEASRKRKALEVQTAQWENRASALEGQIQDTLRMAQQVQTELAGLAASGAELEAQRTKFSESLRKLRESQQSLTLQRQQEEARLTAALEMKKELEASLAEKNSHWNAICGREKAAEEAWMHLRMEENAVSSRVRMLSEMEKLYEGYSKGVKSVMQAAKQQMLPGVHGPVAELLRVPGEYTVAMEIALGGALQHLIVENEEIGKAVLRFARQKDAGRVTCLPMTAIRPFPLRESGLETAEGYLGVAAELVEYDPAYQNIVSNLLGRVVVVRNLDHAVAMAKRWGHRFPIVTLDGEKLNAGGSMTGGSVNRRGGVLSRAAELQELEKKQARVRAQLEDSREKREQAKRETVETAGQLEKLRQESRTQEDLLLTLRHQMESRTVREKGLIQQLEQEQAEFGRLEERTGARRQKAQEQEAALRTAQETAAALRQEKEQLSQEQAEAQGDIRSLQTQERQWSEKLAAMEGEKQSAIQILTELTALRDTFQADCTRQEETLEGFSADNAEIQTDIAAREEALKQLTEDKETQNEALRRCIAEKLRLEGEKNRADRDSREQNEQQLRLQKEVSLLEQKKLQTAMEESQLVDKLWDTYQMTRQGAEQVRIVLENLPKANRRVGELTGAIRALGNVNPGAVEEFQRVNERYTYLSSQKADVESAKVQLEQVIESLTEEMREIFRQEFTRIQGAFQETFLELFGGGRAALELEDESDLLNCGIEIRVQPPGKALRVISLLSGGERAFVAIALYFAILKVRPTPFCVMDEIEAALDEANVARFVRYLRTMSQKTQFILITHRRGTMEASDVLYGVTMEHQGISRILKLNLTEAEEQLGKNA